MSAGHLRRLFKIGKVDRDLRQIPRLQFHAHRLHVAKPARRKPNRLCDLVGNADVRRIQIYVVGDEKFARPNHRHACCRMQLRLADVRLLGAHPGAYERLVNQFPNSPWHDEARYGMGWALQQQKNYDGAANAYSAVVGRTATDLAAKAQLQIGLCRMEQKRYLDAANAFLVIPTTYDYPELKAAALLEAGKAYLELKQIEQANRQFERIVREFPGTPWAEAAKEKLGDKK